jgi:hypothetical protein
VTTVGDISQQMHLSRPILRESPLRCVSYGEVLGTMGLRWRYDELLPRAVDRSTETRRLRIGLTPHAPYTVDLPEYEQCVALSREQGLPLATHLAETPDEREFLERHSGLFRELSETSYQRSAPYVLDSSRSEAHASQILVLRAGKEPLDAWIRGVGAQFDRIVVRLSHIADESHYTGAAEMLTSEPALKWTAIVGTGRARLYAAPTIPTGLYRFGDSEHSGVLSLNFGVISRLTWLDDEGHEGFLNLEGGLMVIGLASSESTTGESLSQAAAVIGLGIGIPFANRSSVTEASINLHLWYEHDLSTSSSTVGGKPWSIIFGPSISIGNVGANL